MSELCEVNDECKKRISSLESYELIEKILFDKDKIKELGILLYKQFFNWNEWSEVYQVKEAITLFLVGCAKYYYNDRQGGFWDAVKSISGIKDHNKQNMIRAFNVVIELNKLEKFENEKVEGYTQIGLILAHAGLPEGLENSFVKQVSCLANSNIPFEKLGDECIESCLLYAPKSLQSYLTIENKLGNLNDNIYDILQILENNEKNTNSALSLSESFQEKIIKFRDTTDYKSKSEYTQRIVKPELFYDKESNIFCIYIPEMKSNTSTVLKVIVYNGENVLTKNIYENGFEKGQYIFRDAVLKIEPEKNISVIIYDDIDNQILKLDIKKDLDELIFNSKGEYVSAGILSNKGGYILCDDIYQCDDAEEICSYSETKLFYIEETCKEKITLFNEDEEKYILIKKQIELIDGEKLFGNNCTFQGISAFYELPSISLPFNGLWKVSVSINEEKNFKEFNLDETIIDLKELIDSNTYGKINIRVHNKFIGYKTFRFFYLPRVEYSFSNYLPGVEGFTKTTITFNNNNSNVSILNKNVKEVSFLECKEEENSIFGIYRYKETDFPFSIMVRPYSWIIENNNEELFTPNTKGFISIKDITKSSDCLLTLKNNTIESVYIKFDNGTIEPKVLKILPCSKRVISLKEYVEYMSCNQNETLIYIEGNYKKICEICSIRVNIAIRSLTAYPFSDDYSILSWEEDGLQKGRELKCRDIEKPYEFFTIPIIDGQTMVSIERDDARFNKCLIIEIALQKKINMFFNYEGEVEDILDSTNSVIYNYPSCGDIEPFTNFNLSDELDYNNCIYSYLTYKFNKNVIKNAELYKKTIQKLLKKIMEARIIYGDEKLINTLFKYNINKTMFDIIVKEVKLYTPIIKNTGLNKKMFKKLESYSPYFYSIYSFLEKDSEQIGRIFNDNCAYLERFIDKENFIFSHKYYLFNDIETIEPIQEKFIIAKKLFYNKRDEECYLLALIEFMVNNCDKYQRDDLPVIIKISNYMKNIFDNYPKTLIVEILKQSGRRK